MKRTKKFLGAFLMAICLCFCFIFAACGSKMEGTYKFKSMTYTEGGVSVEINAGEKLMGMVTLSEDFIKITLEEGGAVTACYSMEEEEVATGTWEKVEDGKIKITFDEEPQICECDGKTLTIEMDGSKVILQKAE